jgi:predicted CoA-binding protein
MNPTNREIHALLSASTYAVVGASRHAHKYGHLVYLALKAAGKIAYAVNPRSDSIEGDRSYPSLADLPSVPAVAVMVVPPAITEAAVADCVRLGIRNVWMQPGAESPAAVAACEAAGITVVWGGPCIMVGLRTERFAPS